MPDLSDRGDAGTRFYGGNAIVGGHLPLAVGMVLDIDSFDFLNFLIGLNEQGDVEIPEADYGQLNTPEELVNYLHGKALSQDAVRQCWNSRFHLFITIMTHRAAGDREDRPYTLRG